MDPILSELVKALGFGSLAGVAVLLLTGRLALPREIDAERDRRRRAESQVDAQTQIINHLADQFEDFLTEQKALRGELSALRSLVQGFPPK